MQIDHQDATVTASNIVVAGNLFDAAATQVGLLVISCNATTGITGLNISGNTFDGVGTADGSIGILWGTTGITNIVGPLIAANNFRNLQFAMKQAAGNSPSNMIVRGNQYGNCASRSNLSVPNVAQTTSKSTGVTSNVERGRITMSSASIAAGASVSFVVSNTQVSTGDVVDVTVQSGAADGSVYRVRAHTITDATSFKITLENTSAGALSEALVLTFCIHKGLMG
jgi:hypothetical protein